MKEVFYFNGFLFFGKPQKLSFGKSKKNIQDKTSKHYFSVSLPSDENAAIDR
jgi:hypothetical protein